MNEATLVIRGGTVVDGGGEPFEADVAIVGDRIVDMGNVSRRGDLEIDATGDKADINVIDYDRLSVGVPEMVCDMPANGKRLVLYTTGYDATFLSGVPVYRVGEAAGTLPGRLVRGAQSAPAASA